MFKRTLLTCTTLLTCHQISAQSSLTIFGMLDAGITYVNNSGGKTRSYFTTAIAIPTCWASSGRKILAVEPRPYSNS